MARGPRGGDRRAGIAIVDLCAHTGRPEISGAPRFCSVVLACAAGIPARHGGVGDRHWLEAQRRRIFAESRTMTLQYLRPDLCVSRFSPRCSPLLFAWRKTRDRAVRPPRRLQPLRALGSVPGDPMAPAPSRSGPERGTVIVVGGGEHGPQVYKAFIDAAGGPDAAHPRRAQRSPPAERRCSRGPNAGNALAHQRRQQRRRCCSRRSPEDGRQRFVHRDYQESRRPSGSTAVVGSTSSRTTAGRRPKARS